MSIFEIRSGPPTHRSLMNKSKDRLAHDYLALVAQLGWHPIRTAPRSGARFLAWCKLTADELDEDENIIEKNKVEYCACVAQFIFGGFVETPYRGSFPVNLEFTHWMPLPAGPEPPR